MPQSLFEPASSDKAALEEGTTFTPRFDANGLVTAVACDAKSGAVLMVAHMNDEALAATLRTGIVHYWSRSRGVLWKKGETSGNVQHVRSITTDCDQDAILLSVDVSGAGITCHTGRPSCFYRSIQIRDGRAVLTKKSAART